MFSKETANSSFAICPTWNQKYYFLEVLIKCASNRTTRIVDKMFWIASEPKGWPIWGFKDGDFEPIFMVN